VKTEENRMTRRTRGAYERRIVAGPEDDAYFSEADQAVIGVDSEGPSEEEKAALESIADENRAAIEQRADSKEVREDQSGDELRSGQRRLISDDQRDEPEGSPNVVEGGTDGSIAGDPYDTGDRRDRGWGERPTARELDRQRGLIGGGEDLTADLDEAELAGAALRRGSGGDGERPKEITAEDAYKRFTLVTDEPFVRWSPGRPGEAKLFVKVRFKTDDLTQPTELPVEVRLREPRVEIAADDFPDMVREDEPLFIRVDADNLPAFHKGLFTLSFDPDMLSFREAELGEFFDDARGADLFYMQPDKLAGKVIFAIDSNTELAELAGGGPLLYVKFKAKRDIASRDETELALVQDTASQYVLDGAGDNILPLAVEHPVYATALVMPAGGAGGFERTLTPGEPTPGMEQRAAEEQAAAARAGTQGPAPNQPAPATGPTQTPNPNLADPNQPPAPIMPDDPRLGTGTEVVAP
jgi:hypothetical protein